MYFNSQFFYKVGKNKDSVFFQSVFAVAILHIAFLFCILGQREKIATLFLAVEMMKRMVCEKNNQWWCCGLEKEI